MIVFPDIPTETWMSWASWGSCSTSCDYGITIRIRQCTREHTCTGIHREGKDCLLVPCETESTGKNGNVK